MYSVFILFVDFIDSLATSQFILLIDFVDLFIHNIKKLYKLIAVELIPLTWDYCYVKSYINSLQ